MLISCIHFIQFSIGTFNLDLSWKPLVKNIFEHNLKWVELLAATRNVKCEIIDETIREEMSTPPSGILILF